jgi:predicted transcriptional regulator
MKENTKYHNYKFVGKISVDEIQPWFDFASIKPWDQGEIPWVLENRVRREILIFLADGPKSYKEIYDIINFSPKPLLITKDEYDCQVSYQWAKETLENHLLNSILKFENLAEIDNYINMFSQAWIKIIKETKNEIEKHLAEIKDNIPLYEILVEKAVEKLYELLKNEEFLPQEPNIKVLWAEQLRGVKFEEWVDKNF